MNLRIVIAAVIITGALIGGDVVRLQASAGGPIIFRQQIDDIATTTFCGFPMEIRTTGTAVIHLFLDDDGGFQRVIVTAPRTRLTFTNTATGESVWTPSVNMVQEIANADGTGTQTLRGLFWHLVVPGEGLVAVDVCRIAFVFTFDDLPNIVSEEVAFEAGQWEGQFIPMLCSALQS